MELVRVAVWNNNPALSLCALLCSQLLALQPDGVLIFPEHHPGLSGCFHVAMVINTATDMDRNEDR